MQPVKAKISAVNWELQARCGNCPSADQHICEEESEPQVSQPKQKLQLNTRERKKYVT